MLHNFAAYFGYLASFCLIMALLISNDLKFRIFNTLGNIFFIIYAVIFDAWPVLITNGILIAINVYYLSRIMRHKENFDLLEFEGEETLVKKFLSFYNSDIIAYFPEFTAPQLKGNLNFAVTRDLVVANIFSADISAEGDAAIIINYTTKKYRDYKIGRFIFEKEKKFLASKGIKRVVYKKVQNKNHKAFLKKMGFIKEGESYCKML